MSLIPFVEKEQPLESYNNIYILFTSAARNDSGAVKCYRYGILKKKVRVLVESHEKVIKTVTVSTSFDQNLPRNSIQIIYLYIIGRINVNNLLNISIKKYVPILFATI